MIQAFEPLWSINMSNISSLGNQIFINQNTPAIVNKFINSHARLISQDIVNSDNFEENHKRLKDTREMEEVAEIDEHLVDNAVYSVNPQYKKRDRDENRENNPYILNDKKKKIDITI